MKKRVLSILLTLCMVLMLCPVTAFADEPLIKGDVNYDGQVTIHDASLLQKCLEGLESFDNLPEGALIAADFNGDGVVNYSDLTELQSYLELPVRNITVTNGKATACGTEIGKAAKGTRVTLTADSPSDDKGFDQWIVNEGGVTLADASSATTTFTMSEDPVSVTATYKLSSAGETDTLAITIEGFQVGKTPADCEYTFASTIPGVTFSEDDIQYIRWEKYVADGDSYPISNTDAFQAGRRYKCFINLDNNGLTEAPTVTVNGNTPDYCTLSYLGGAPKALVIGCDLGTPVPSQYTITYDGGEGVEGSIASDVKARGEDFTLSSDTFTWDGYVQTGWIDGYGATYDLGGVYTLDEDMTFSPYWEKLITLTVPYTTTVALGDAGEPGETAFDLALIGSGAGEYDAADVTVSGSVTTDGAGSYNGALTITGPEGTLWHMLSEGAFVQQADAGADGWTVDDTVWGLLMQEIPVAYAMSDDAVASEYTVYVVPASIDGNGDYYIDWENLQTADMTFTNTYTAHAYALNHDADGHWDECAGCKDKQNEEPHQYGDWKVTKEATEKEAGKKEHTCTVCGYTEKAEIAKLAAKPGTDTKPDTPATGDNSHMALWVALLFVSGGLLTVTGVYSKRKKHSEN